MEHWLKAGNLCEHARKLGLLSLTFWLASAIVWHVLSSEYSDWWLCEASRWYGSSSAARRYCAADCLKLHLLFRVAKQTMVWWVIAKFPSLRMDSDFSFSLETSHTNASLLQLQNCLESGFRAASGGRGFLAKDLFSLPMHMLRICF